MKLAITQTLRQMLIICGILFLFAALNIISLQVVTAFLIGLLVAHFVMNKFISQLDKLPSGQLPSSNFAFNMLVYTIMFLAMIKVSTIALLMSFLGLIGYRKLYFMHAQKNLKKGG